MEYAAETLAGRRGGRRELGVCVGVGGRGRKDKVLRGGLPVCVLSHQPAAQTAHPSGLAPDAHS